MGILGKETMTVDQIKALADVPNKETSISMLMSVMNGPVRNFASVLNAIPRSLVIALNAVREQKESA